VIIKLLSVKFHGFKFIGEMKMTIAEWACQPTNGTSFASGVVSLTNVAIGERRVTTPRPSISCRRQRNLCSLRHFSSPGRWGS
jgi:hypothetical protein